MLYSKILIFFAILIICKINVAYCFSSCSKELTDSVSSTFDGFQTSDIKEHIEAAIACGASSTYYWYVAKAAFENLPESSQKVVLDLLSHEQRTKFIKELAPQLKKNVLSLISQAKEQATTVASQTSSAISWQSITSVGLFLCSTNPYCAVANLAIQANNVFQMF
eukprot:c15624_g2_i1.p1 GENE.c15624_g2_i1~~c15624_g2_i1.p1  ORF type:complete len:165 (+),score=33.70 c15624_g2_i1:24-518(+)